MTYVMSDIHGDGERFERIMKQINLQPDDTLYILGDVIDRKPDGIRLLRRIMKTPNIKMLLGNHEYMMMDALVYPPSDKVDKWSRDYSKTRELRHWYENGGDVTHAYLKRIRKELRQEIFDYIDSLPLNIPEGRIKDMTFNMYFDYASIAFNAAGYDTKGMTPYEQFRRYGEDFGGFILENLPHDTPEGFLFYCDDRNHSGGHPWGLVRGSSRTRLFLWPRKTEEGFYFTFNGNEVFMAYEMVKMYLALKDSGLPVRYGSCKKDIIEYLRQDDLIGIVPIYEIALYRQHEFPNQEVEDFMHFYPEEGDDIADLIEWQPIMPIVFKGESND